MRHGDCDEPDRLLETEAGGHAPSTPPSEAAAGGGMPRHAPAAAAASSNISFTLPTILANSTSIAARSEVSSSSSLIAVLGLAPNAAWGVGQARAPPPPTLSHAEDLSGGGDDDDDDPDARWRVLVRNGRIRTESLRIHSSHR